MGVEHTDMFSSKVDKRSRTAMVHFLSNHFRYYTANSWNRSTSYANNVKIHKLPIPAELQDLAYDIAYGAVRAPDFDFICEEEFRAFLDDTGYFAGFNGRSGGYIVMYETKRKENSNEIIAMCGMPIDQNEDFDDKDEWDMRRLRDRVALVERFDQMCMTILARFIELLKTSKVKTHTVVKTEEYKVLVPDADDSTDADEMN